MEGLPGCLPKERGHDDSVTETIDRTITDPPGGRQGNAGENDGKTSLSGAVCAGSPLAEARWRWTWTRKCTSTPLPLRRTAQASSHSISPRRPASSWHSTPGGMGNAALPDSARQGHGPADRVQTWAGRFVFVPGSRADDATGRWQVEAAGAGDVLRT